MLTVLAILLPLPALGLLTLALRHRLPQVAMPGACGALLAELVGLCAAATSTQPWTVAPASLGFGAALVAVLYAVNTLERQLDPWWWGRFRADLADWEAGRDRSRV